MKRTVAAAIIITAFGAGFGALKIGQHMAVTPALRAHLFPTVVILRIAANIDHAIDGGAAADYPAARQIHDPAIEIGFGLGVIAPAIFFHPHRYRKRGRHIDKNRTVAAAGLEDRHAMGPIRTQPIRENTTRRTRTDNDKIRFPKGH